MQPQAHNPDALWQAVLDIMAEAGHGHLLPELEDYTTDKGSEVDDIHTLPMQGLSIPFACVGSGDPVRVLHLFTTNTLDIL